MVKFIRNPSSLGTNTPIYLLGKQQNNPLLNLQYYSLNNKNNLLESESKNIKYSNHKPQYGESKYTSSLHVGKMHKIISKKLN